MIQQRSERVLETIPVGSLGIIPLPSCKELGDKVNDYLVQWRKESANEHKDNIAFQGYEQESFLVGAKIPRFGSGEAKGIVQESVRGRDLYLMVDVCNHSLTYSLAGHTNHMSPDDHYQDLKRIIAACGGKQDVLLLSCHFSMRAVSINVLPVSHWTAHWLCRSWYLWV